MHIKRYIVKEMRVLHMQKKGMGLLFYVPLVVNWGMIPFLSWLIFQHWGDTEQAYTQILSYLQYFVPFISSWWLLFSFAEYVEGEGNELYFVQNRMRMRNALEWMMIYVIIMLMPFLLYADMIRGFHTESLRMIIECAMFSGITYALLFLSAVVPITLVILLVYSTFCSLGAINTENILIYHDIRPWSMNLFTEKYIYLLLLSVVAFISGAVVNYKFQRFQ